MSPEVAAYAAELAEYERLRSQRTEARVAAHAMGELADAACRSVLRHKRAASDADPAGLAAWEAGRNAQGSKP